jgi:outer membrane protein assembly factor BamB
LVNSITTTFGSIGGLAFDRDSGGGPFLFAGTRATPPTVFALNPTSGSVLYAFDAPVNNNALRGLAWDGNYLWTIDNVYGSPNVGMVYRFYGHEPYPAVVPNSPGRIETIYR